MKVLLVEDSARLAARIKEALEQLDGVDVVATVADEQSAIDVARREAVDVIVLTNYALPEYRRRAAELGVEYFLDKSRDYERLPEVLQRFQARSGT